MRLVANQSPGNSDRGSNPLPSVMTDWQQDMIAKLCRENDMLIRELRYSVHREYKTRIKMLERANPIKEEWEWWRKWQQWK